MQSILSEKKGGTLEWLLSTPASVHEVVLGKALARFLVCLVLLSLFFISFLIPYIVSQASTVKQLYMSDFGRFSLGIVLFLWGAIMLGVSLSAFCKNAATVFALCFLALILINSTDSISTSELYDIHRAPIYNAVKSFLSFISMKKRLLSFATGFETDLFRDIMYFIDFAVLMHLIGWQISNKALK